MTHVGGSSNPRRENSASHGRAPGGLAGVGAGGEKRDHRGTKNPAYSDVLYMEMLIGPNTISTIPLETLRLFEHHGVVDNTLPGNVARTRLSMRMGYETEVPGGTRSVSGGALHLGQAALRDDGTAGRTGRNSADR
jgi:hypothetical protein